VVHFAKVPIPETIEQAFPSAYYTEANPGSKARKSQECVLLGTNA